MKYRLVAILVSGLFLAGCGWISPASPPELIPLPASQSAATPQAAIAAGLSAEQVKNAKYNLVSRDGNPSVQLTNGAFQNGTNPAATDYMSIVLAPQMAFGDLNGDGVGDAAVLLTENYGGTGVFVSVVALLDQNGQPVQAGAELIDDRPVINSLSIQDGQILLDAKVHGPNDPGCCASQSTQRAFRYESGKLVMVSYSSLTSDGSPRLITIDSPASGAQVSWPLTVTGKVTIAPFENGLGYSVYDSKGDQVLTNSFLVDAAQPGGQGTFSLPLDLSQSGLAGPIRIEIVDVSPADGSIQALASVEVSLK